MGKHRKTHGGVLGENPRLVLDLVVVEVVASCNWRTSCLTEGAPQTRRTRDPAHSRHWHVNENKKETNKLSSIDLALS